MNNKMSQCGILYNLIPQKYFFCDVLQKGYINMKKKLALLAAVIMSFAVLTGCNNISSDTGNATTEEQADSADNNQAQNDEEKKMHDRYDSAIHPVTELPQLGQPNAGDTVATIHTSMGDIKVWFFPQYAPKAVENFTTHASEGYYDNVIFHRVINQFMIQGGDPLGTGTGGESIWGDVFENEVDTNLRSFRGALCMANSGPDTNGSQFYIVQSQDIGDDMKKQLTELSTNKDEAFYTTADGTNVTFADVFTKAVVDEYCNNGGYPSLDFSYTVFGQVYEGMDVVDKIAAVEVNENDKPLNDVTINSIEVGTY